MSLATILGYVLVAYAVTGLCVALGFVTFGLQRVVSASYTLGARILIVPGAFALWPYVLCRWLASERPS